MYTYIYRGTNPDKYTNVDVYCFIFSYFRPVQWLGVIVKQGSASSLKSQVVNLFGFIGQMSSRNYSTLLLEQGGRHRQCMNKWMWLIFQYNFICKGNILDSKGYLYMVEK